MMGTVIWYLTRATPFFPRNPVTPKPFSFRTPVDFTCVPPQGYDQPVTRTTRMSSPLLRYSEKSKFVARRLHSFSASSTGNIKMVVGMSSFTRSPKCCCNHARTPTRSPASTFPRFRVFWAGWADYGLTTPRTHRCYLAQAVLQP